MKDVRSALPWFCRMVSAAMLLAMPWLSKAGASPAPTPAELSTKTQWVQQNLLTATNLPPFSFNYSTLSSSRFLAGWNRSQTDTVLDANRTQHEIIWTNNVLQVRCLAVEYNDYPVVEWTVYLKNISAGSTTPLLDSLKGLDTTVSRTSGPEFILNGNQGDSDVPQSYQPFQITLSPGSVNNFSPPSYSGRSCDASGWPYFNLQTPDGGRILAIGWPGQWASSFTRDAGNNLQIVAGQQTTHLVLTPGEQIRTPLITLLFWKGTDVVRSQNLWRRWYLAHVLPRVNGQPSTAVTQIQGDNVASVNANIQAGIHPDILWRDAGSGPGSTWYPSANGPYTGNLSWLNTGTWDIDSSVYPNGFLPTSQAVHAQGVQFLLWFEPERVGNTNNSFLATNNPAWLLPATSMTVGAILNEGNPQAFNWLTNHIENLIVSNGIDWYREDMNGNGPLTAWQAKDTLLRQGMTENLYVQGHLAFWDALLAMNPGLRIDCCGSGGRRNDLEAMRRAVPLTRSDYQVGDMDTVANGNQCHTYALSSWLPFQGSGCYFNDLYAYRSFYLASFGTAFGLAPDNVAGQKQAYTECKKIAPLLLNGDYYPLTPYSLNDNVWMAWQFDRSDTGEGCVQAFRRTNSSVASMTFQLQGLAPGVQYNVQDFDKGNLGTFSGSQLMSTGLTVTLAPRQSAVFYYTNLPGMTLTAGGTPTVGASPLSVQFNASGAAVSRAPVSYAWDFGDGNTSTNKNPSHVYSSGGRYTAQVMASDGLGNSNTVQVPVVVLQPRQTMDVAFTNSALTETLTNFPVLFEFGPSLSGNGFSYSQVASSKGWDLVFTDAGQLQTLNYEIEKWDTNGTSYVWVQVPLLKSNTVIRVYWGDTNMAATSPTSLTNGAVWSNGFAGVWHLADGVNLSGTDSTANHVDAAVHNATSATGVIDGAASFNGASAYLDAGTANSAITGSQLTMSAWVNPSAGTVILMKGNDNTAHSCGLEWSGNAALLFTYGSGPAWMSDGGATLPHQWSHVTGVINGNSELLYVNGQLRASNTFSGTISNTNSLSLWLGAQNRPSYNYWLNGTVDEARVSSVARSAAWVRAEFLTSASNNVFNGYGAVKAFGTTFPPVPLSIVGETNSVVVSWPTNSNASAVLQFSPDLLHWTSSPAPITIEGTNNAATLLIQDSAQFYRLVN